MRIGNGYDIHLLLAGRALILGGIEIPFAKGLQGHSDGDVLIHAVADAILGALGMGDIGHYYPDTDPRLKGMSSLRMLDDLKQELEKRMMKIGNLDTVIIAEAPKLAPFTAAMRSSLAQHLATEEARVNIKAKTGEKLDAIGRGEAIAVHAVALLIPL
ncbi:MAG: 2-C-methyl-D-erythritol 2,4-cyclodiphosphate synthase [Nitrospirae bacterium]|nr:2-C-methyl-D-erythritol 2,4-cyclodiphosphate synthase [Nitrospirota bacterium]